MARLSDDMLRCIKHAKLAAALLMRVLASVADD
jgi:hypothetical protein